MQCFLVIIHHRRQLLHTPPALQGRRTSRTDRRLPGPLCAALGLGAHMSARQLLSMLVGKETTLCLCCVRIDRHMHDALAVAQYQHDEGRRQALAKPLSRTTMPATTSLTRHVLARAVDARADAVICGALTFGPMRHINVNCECNAEHHLMRDLSICSQTRRNCHVGCPETVKKHAHRSAWRGCEQPCGPPPRGPHAACRCLHHSRRMVAGGSPQRSWAVAAPALTRRCTRRATNRTQGVPVLAVILK